MKKLTAILLALLLLVSLSACAKSAADGAYYSSNTASYTPEYAKSDGYDYPAEEPEATYDVDYKVEESSMVDNTPTESFEKIIYTAQANIQSLDFDASVEMVSQLTADFGGYIQSSSVTGTDLNRRYKSYRNASFTLRIPTERFKGFQNVLDQVGNVTYFNQDQENISLQYYDTESRLTTYRTEEERLLAMLEKCETVEDMIAIESRLSDVRYSIESLTTTLRRFDQLVAYSTLYLNINEVEEYIEQTPIVRGYWEQIGDGFVSSLKGVGNFFKNLFKNLLIALPYLVLWAVILFVAFLVIRAIVRARRARKAANGDTPKTSRKLRRKEKSPEIPEAPKDEPKE